MNRKKTTITINGDLLKAIKKQAVDENKQLSYMIEKTISEYLEKIRKESK